MSRRDPSTGSLELVGYLRSIPYSEYRQSRWWRERREAFRATHDFCWLCTFSKTAARSGEPIDLRFHVHHLSYERLGEEQDDDLVLLCSRCHNLVHYPESAAARFWRETVERFAHRREEHEWFHGFLWRLARLLRNEQNAKDAA